MADEYSGRDNLEVMALAANYNCFLTEAVANWSQGMTVLVDFGAGSGTFAVMQQRPGRRLICVETDAMLQSQLRAKGLEVIDNLERADNASIDGVYSLNVLEHIENDTAVIRMWSAKLKAGGSVFVYVPAFMLLYSSMDKKVGHVRRYTRQELERKFREQGFTVTESRYADSLGFFAALLYKWLDNGKGDINARMLRIYDRWVFPLSRLLDTVFCRVFGKNVLIKLVKN
jgi:hypothetical protein